MGGTLPIDSVSRDRPVEDNVNIFCTCNTHALLVGRLQIASLVTSCQRWLTVEVSRELRQLAPFMHSATQRIRIDGSCSKLNFQGSMFQCCKTALLQSANPTSSQETDIFATLDKLVS